MSASVRDLAIELPLLAIGALIVGILGYVVGSYFFARAHLEDRPFTVWLRAAIAEAGWSLLTQPLIPLYYLRGHRMAAGTGEPVVLVHGYFQNRANFVSLARALARAGLGPVYGFNYPWIASIDANAKRLGRYVERVCKETGAAQVSLVAHSMGGLVALDYLHDASGKKRVRRCVTIATPHAGVAWKGPILGVSGAQMRQLSPFLQERVERRLAVPTLSIFSTHDNIVHPMTTSALATRGGTDVQVEHVGHLAILFDPRVHAEVIRFLSGGTMGA